MAIIHILHHTVKGKKGRERRNGISRNAPVLQNCELLHCCLFPQYQAMLWFRTMGRRENKAPISISASTSLDTGIFQDNTLGKLENPLCSAHRQGTLCTGHSKHLLLSSDPVFSWYCIGPSGKTSFILILTPPDSDKRAYKSVIIRFLEGKFIFVSGGIDEYFFYCRGMQSPVCCYALYKCAVPLLFAGWLQCLCQTQTLLHPGVHRPLWLWWHNIWQQMWILQRSRVRTEMNLFWIIKQFNQSTCKRRE